MLLLRNTHVNYQKSSEFYEYYEDTGDARDIFRETAAAAFQVASSVLCLPSLH